MHTSAFNFKDAPYTWILAHIHYSGPNGYYYFDLEEARTPIAMRQIITAAFQAGMDISFNLFYFNIADPIFSRKNYNPKEYKPICGCYYKPPEHYSKEKQDKASEDVWRKLNAGAYKELEPILEKYYKQFGDDLEPFVHYIGTWNVMYVYRMYVMSKNT